MGFAPFVFGLGLPVLPIAIGVWSPLPLAYDTVWSPLHLNLVRMAFQPFHVFRLRLLAPQRAAPSEAAPAFASRVAHMLAAELGVPATSHTTKDKATHLQGVRRLGKAEYLRLSKHDKAL
mmetsp:Transcript_12228/g.38858  ORF Transcript_12228/g.38858 Transcript_12228/m.38858 type:complete len:120 (-) Transcript_12228:57-416(-)